MPRVSRRGNVLWVPLASLGLLTLPATTRTLEEAAKDTHTVVGGHLMRRESAVMEGEAQLPDYWAMWHARAKDSLHSKGMSCKSGGHLLWNGTDPTCRRRCETTPGCKYFTTYRGDFCEISSSCDNETVSSDLTAITFSTLAACDGILDDLACDYDATYDEKCNNIEFPCKDGQRPCFKLYDHDRTGLVGHSGRKLSVVLHLGNVRKVTRIDTVGTFLHDFTLESSHDNTNWTRAPGSFRSNGFSQIVPGGLEGAHVRLTWEDSDDSGKFFPGFKAFLKGC